MRVRLPGIRASLVALAVGPLSSACFGGFGGSDVWTGPPFAADVVDPHQMQKAPTRVYIGGGRVRMESGDSASRIILVFDPGTQTMLLIDVAHRTYVDAGMFTRVIAAGFAPLLRFFRPTAGGDPCVQWNATVGQFASFAAQFSGGRNSGTPPHLTCRDEGGESVNGRPAEKWMITEDTQHETSTVWIDNRLHVITKSMDHNGDMELRNVQEGPQPDALFAPPSGYQRVSVTDVLARLKNMTQGASTPAGVPDKPAGQSP